MSIIINIYFQLIWQSVRYTNHIVTPLLFIGYFDSIVIATISYQI